MKTLRLETTAPFQGLAELVAYDEGLFEKEGIQIEWMDREKGVDKSPQLHITDHKEASRYTSHGKHDGVKVRRISTTLVNGVISRGSKPPTSAAGRLAVVPW